MKLKFKPSDYARWGTCTASPAATAGVETETKAYAVEGTVAHELLATCLGLGSKPVEFSGFKLNCGSIGEHDVELDMVDAVQEAIDYIDDHIPAHWERYVEHKVDLSEILPGQSGVIDFVAFDAEAPTELHIIDYKHGKGVKVFAERNGELMLHAFGAVRNLLSLEQRGVLEKIVLHIMQPRIGHMDRWECTRADLEHFALEASAKRREALDPSRRQFVPSVEGCRFCPIKADCRALRDSVYARVLDDPNGIGMELKDLERLSVEELAASYEWFDFIAAWANNAKEYMRKKAIQGVEFPGLKLVEGKNGHRKWKDDDSAVQFMKEGHKLEDFEIYDMRVISPSKFERMVGKKNTGELFKEMTTQEKGQPQLVKESEPGIPLKEAQLAEFDDLSGDD